MENVDDGVKKDYGGSLPVENVQELSSKQLKEVPIRYIRPELQFDEVSLDQSLQIPVIDLNKITDDQQGEDSELAKLHMACRDWGFFQLINHGVAEEVIEKMKMEVENFFKLPLEEKMAFSQEPNSIEGYGQAFVVSDQQKLDWGDMLFLISRPLSLRFFTFWQTASSTFRATLDEYSSELQRIATHVMKLIGRNLGVDGETIGSLFGDGAQGIRMNYYPPCLEANKVVGLTAHSDAPGLTLLTQVNQVEGLQIKKDSKWVPIKPISGAFIVNVGDIIEIMSNGEYRSIEHRAVVNPEKERLSVATFHSPNGKAMIGPLPQLVKNNKPIYKTIAHDDFNTLVVTSKLDGKSLISRMRLES